MDESVVARWHSVRMHVFCSARTVYCLVWGCSHERAPWSGQPHCPRRMLHVRWWNDGTTSTNGGTILGAEQHTNVCTERCAVWCSNNQVSNIDTHASSFFRAYCRAVDIIARGCWRRRRLRTSDCVSDDATNGSTHGGALSRTSGGHNTFTHRSPDHRVE